ncbi:MAG: hypothetical protein R2862_10195 [Thermoanaerobaculia bacterium]
MQVGVEEAVVVQHPDDRRGAEVDQLVAILLGEVERALRARLEAVEELHADDVAPRELAVDLREDDVGHVAEVGRESLGVVRLARQVELAQRVLGELLEHLARLEALEEGLQEASEEVEEDGVAAQRLAVSRLDDLEDDVLAGEQLRPVDLADRRRAERVGIDPLEHRDDRAVEVLLDDLLEAVERHGGQPVEQVLELVGDDLRQQVLAQRQDLAELDVGRSEDLEVGAGAAPGTAAIGSRGRRTGG